MPAVSWLVEWTHCMEIDCMVCLEVMHNRLLHAMTMSVVSIISDCRGTLIECFGFDRHCIGSVPSEDAETWIMITILTLDL